MKSPYKYLVFNQKEMAEAVKKTKTYATEVEIEILAKELEININTICVKPNLPRPQLFLIKGSDNPKAIILLNKSDHFEPVVDTEALFEKKDCEEAIKNKLEEKPVSKKSRKHVCALCEDIFKTSELLKRHEIKDHRLVRKAMMAS